MFELIYMVVEEQPAVQSTVFRKGTASVKVMLQKVVREWIIYHCDVRVKLIAHCS